MKSLLGGVSFSDLRTMKRDKILIITNHSYMLWQFRRELIAKLMESYEVILSMPFVGHENDFMAMGLRCIRTEIDRRGVNPVKDFKLIEFYRKMLQEVKPDLVITYSIKPNIYAGLLCGRMGIPFCANVQGLGTAFEKPGLAQFVTVLYRQSFRKVGMVFFENTENAREFLTRRIVPKQKVKVLHGAGINLDYYAYQPYPRNEKFHFLYLGRIMKEKGIDELFDAVRQLKKEKADFILDLVGFFEDDYEQQVQDLEKEGIVKFHGFQEDPRPFYAMSDCVVLPSYHEGMSNVLLEAAATGRPLITTDVSGCREAVIPEESGLLVQIKDSESLYHAMRKMLNLSQQERSLMGQKGRERMRNEFRKETVIEETIQGLIK